MPVNPKFALTTCALALAAFASPAVAADDPVSDSDFVISGSATVTSDYRLRGVSHSDRRMAVQGQIGVAHSSGLYAGIWGSSIDSDSPIAGGAGEEMIFYGGFRKPVGRVTLDAGWHYLFYPGHNSGQYATKDSNFLEGFVAASSNFGPVNARVEADYAPKQKSLASPLRPEESSQDNLYVQAQLSGTIPGTPVTIAGHVGHTVGPSHLTYSEDNYTDWSLTAAYTWKRLTFTVGYLDTSIKNGTTRSLGSGHDLAKAGVFGSISVGF